MITLDLINSYLEDKEPTWSKATFNSERARLRKMIDILNMEPLEALTELRNNQGLKPYTVKTMFVRAASIYKHLINKGSIKGPNKFQGFLEGNSQVFRNVYTRESVPCTYGEALELIGDIQDPACREQALYMLKSGLRIHEVYKVQVDHDKTLYVVGKGGKRRRVFMRALPSKLAEPYKFRAELAKIGLKPHSLRKILATDLFNRDFKAQDLCKIMGWSKLETAISYLQSKNDAAIMSAMDRDGSEQDRSYNPDWNYSRRMDK